jgi:hypothetical protein
VKIVFDGYQMANLLVLLSFGTDLVYMPAMVHGLAHGDGALAATILQRAVTETPSGVTGYPLQWGVFCREQMAFTSPATLLKTAQRILPGFPTSTLRLLPQIPQPYGDCKVWNVGKAGPKTHKMTKSNVPVLLLSGTFDLVTAPREARVAAGTPEPGNQRSAAPARANGPRNNQIVLASGTGSRNARPTKPHERQPALQLVFGLVVR